MRYSLLKVCRTSYDGTMYPYRIPEFFIIHILLDQSQSSGQVAYAVCDEIYVIPCSYMLFPPK